MIPPPVSVCVFAGARSPMPAARDVLSWGAFCDEIAALCREETAATDKRDLVAFGPYRLRDGAPRAAANVERMSAVVMLDVDGVDLDALRARLAGLGVSAIVHGTPNDDPAGVRKARISACISTRTRTSSASSSRAMSARRDTTSRCSSVRISASSRPMNTATMLAVNSDSSAQPTSTEARTTNAAPSASHCVRTRLRTRFADRLTRATALHRRTSAPRALLPSPTTATDRAERGVGW